MFRTFMSEVAALGLLFVGNVSEAQIAGAGGLGTRSQPPVDSKLNCSKPVDKDNVIQSVKL